MSKTEIQEKVQVYHEAYFKKVDEILDILNEEFDETIVKQKVNEMLYNGAFDCIKVMTAVQVDCDITEIPTKIIYNDYCKMCNVLGFKVVSHDLFSKLMVKYFNLQIILKRYGKERFRIFIHKLI